MSSTAMQPSSSAQGHALPLSASSVAAAGEPIQCNGCKQGLEDSLDNTVVSFGSSFFHVDCRCAKCSRHVEHNMSLLLLADGNPVCENCKYICSSCQKPIHNEAIVTGDESYHSECFRCRSCQNKIEELIFAKTNQGIWCMACHNERVARTRKHAEAKRNRQARKDRDNGSSSTSVPRSSRSRVDRPPPSDGGDRSADLPDLPSAPSHAGDLSASAAAAASTSPPPPQVRPLPPSPGPATSSYGRTSSFDNGVAHQRAQTTPGDAPRHTPALPLAPSASSQSIAALSRSASPLHPPVPPPPHSHPHSPSHARTASQLSEEHPHPHPARRASASGLRNEFSAAGSSTGTASASASASASSPRRPSGDYPPPRPESPLPPPVPVLSGDAFGPGPSLPDKQGRPGAAPGTTSSASLAAPTMSKSERRRSGFYGAQARPSLGEEAISAQLGGAVASSNEAGEPALAPEALFAPSTTPPNPPAHPHPHQHSHPHPHPHSHSHAPSPPHAPSSSDDLHTSMSFYDPDTLLFLNHVGGAPSSSLPDYPSSSLAPGPADKALPDPTLSLNDEAIERLGTPSPAPSAVASGDDATDDDTPLGAIGGGGSGGGGGNGVARRVRESIRLQKRESEGRASEGTGSAPLSVAGLDVELVEMLLAELEATKKEMKEIKSRYNAFRRASRSAFEGFSMAREEYDKEAAARREAEHQMQILRAKFIEQARRLAQVDEEQKTAETLKRQSKDLRTSVVGMERHLSQLKAEVALSTAQVAELTALGKDEPGSGTAASVPDRTSSSTAHDEVAEALNARLETVKDVHRDEINALVAQRDELSRQVAELKLARDAHLEEASELAARNLHLVEKNNEAARQLDGLHESLCKLSLLSSKSAASAAAPRNGGGHAHSPSNASLLTTMSSVSASASGARSPLATARYISSPAEGESMHRFAKPEVVEASSRNKFWGKSKPKVPVADVSRANQQLPPPPPGSSSAGTKSPVVSMRSGSVDSGVRQHAFQVTSILRPVRCDYCGDKMWGLNEMRCTACGSYAHAKCSGYLSSGCHPGGSGPSAQVDDVLNFVPTGPPMFGGDLEDQAHKEGVEVPTVVDKCIEAVEAFGMTYEGIYRKTGGMGQTKLITQYFERGLAFDLQDRDKFNDIAAITSCMKNYFRSLPVPLMTHDLHEDFVAAAELPDGDERLQAIERVLYQLPPAHFHTARLLFRHLNHVKSLSAENKMTSANLGVVFGPTVLRSPIAAREWSDMGPKAKLVEILCDHAEALFAKPFPPTA
ncbi:hypothetical protein JCM8208_003596 [Rhodotorula glutinis]